MECILRSRYKDYTEYDGFITLYFYITIQGVYVPTFIGEALVYCRGVLVSDVPRRYTSPIYPVDFTRWKSNLGCISMVLLS